MKLLSCVQLFATPWTVAHQAPPSMNFLGKSTRVGCHVLLQVIFLGQGLLYCRQRLYHLTHQGSLSDITTYSKWPSPLREASLCPTFGVSWEMISSSCKQFPTHVPDISASHGETVEAKLRPASSPSPSSWCAETETHVCDSSFKIHRTSWYASVTSFTLDFALVPFQSFLLGVSFLLLYYTYV